MLSFEYQFEWHELVFVSSGLSFSHKTIEALAWFEAFCRAKCLKANLTIWHYLALLHYMVLSAVSAIMRCIG